MGYTVNIREGQEEEEEEEEEEESQNCTAEWSFKGACVGQICDAWEV
jgi:hypothetical protein